MGPGEPLVTARHADLAALRESETARMLAACSQCGACVEACPMVPYVPALQDADRPAVVRGVLEVLTGGEGDAASRAWIASCTRTGSCNAACPEAVNPQLMIRLATWRASETGLLPQRDTSIVMSRVKVFARLGFTEDEQRDWL